MKLKKIREVLDEVLFLENKEDWDNSGLLIGDEENEITNVLVALELTKDVLDLALAKKMDMIITHHPAIFSTIKTIVKKEDERNYIYDLIKNNIALYAAHTNFDKLHDGMDTYIGRLLGGFNFENLENTDYGIGFKVDMVNAKYLGEKLISSLDLEAINAIGNLENNIEKVAVITGSGSDMYSFVKENGAQLFITGDIKYHFAQDILKEDIVVFDIGHYGSEKIFSQVFIEKFANLLKDLNVECYSGNQNPFKLILRR
ncbi:MAG: Nif3-like dinuclear metal center hexameric protein [Filifactoraceae bacterium]